ncbi:golgin subfamily A member 6-like protein 25 [Cardiocondyla obscurior]|uniref:golgin subfamily A member 6-like protein 25 n=1 Tax=Cardiocondyla obscurior TaxID=286306 RepID=UPI00396587EC
MSDQMKENMELGREEKREEKTKKKMGRPAKVEILRRERSNSLPIMEAWKQGEKRKERQEERGEIEGLEGFRKSVKVYRSPVKTTEESGEGGVSKESFEEVIKEMRSGFARIQAQMEEEKKYEGGKAEMPAELYGNVLSLEERTRMLEMGKERQKKEWRKNNLIIRGIKIKNEDKKALKEQVGEIFEAIGVKAKIEDVNKGGFYMVWVKMENFKDKLEILKGKGKLKDRTEWIGDDLTEYERKVEWNIKREAERLKREGNQVKIGYKKIWVNKEMWLWNDLKEELRKWEGAKTFETEGNKKQQVTVDKINASF